MRESKKKIGLFSNAKYSRPVFRNVPPSVIEKANKDIEALIRPSIRCARSQRMDQEAPVVDRKAIGMKRIHHEAFQKIQHVQQTPEASNGCLETDALADFRWGHHVQSRSEEPTKKCHRLLSSRTANRVPAVVAIPSLERSIDSDFGFEDFSSEKSAQASVKNQRYFPTEAPIEKIVHNMLLSFPKLTLKNNEPMEYADAAFTIARNALVTQVNQSSLKNATAPSLTTMHLPEVQINETAFATMRDKTMNFYEDYPLESEDWSQDGNLDDESPTSYHLTFTDVPDPQSLPQTFEELGGIVEEHVVHHPECNKDEDIFEFRKQLDSNEYAWDLPLRAECSCSDVISPEYKRVGQNVSQSQYETSFLAEKKYF